VNRDRLLRVLRWVASIVVVLLVVKALAGNWSKVQSHLSDLSAGWMLLAVVSVLAGLFCTMLSWRALLADLGSPLPLRPATRIFFLSQLGKYVPGSVWPVVAQMELGREYDVPRKRSATAGLVTLALSLVAGALVAVAAVPFMSDDAKGRAWPVLLLLPAGAVLLHPPIFSRLVDGALKVIRKEPLEHPLSRPGELRALGWAVLAWVIFGVHAWAIARDLGASGAGLFPIAVSGFALAWTVGFLAIFVPAGIGVREFVIGAVFGTFFAKSSGGPAAIAIVSRLCMSLGDVIWAAVAVASSRRTARTSQARTAPTR
jgi:uncharacterized membrane protein YbhN (UPF0104 family)